MYPQLTKRRYEIWQETYIVKINRTQIDLNMETAQQQHNRISLLRIDSGLEYLRRKQQQLLQQRERRDNYGSILMPSSFIQLPNSNFSSSIKPIAYVQPRTNLNSSPPPPYVSPSRYPVNVRTNPRVSPSHDYSRNKGKGMIWE